MSCQRALCDISGKTRIETEDSRWVQFTDLEILTLRGDETWWEEICEGFITNNTGNLLVFFEKTKHQLRQVLVQRGKRLPSPRIDVEKCCISLHLSTLLMHHFARTLSDDEVSECE